MASPRKTESLALVCSLGALPGGRVRRRLGDPHRGSGSNKWSLLGLEPPAHVLELSKLEGLKHLLSDPLS